jgi:hypothetical protein
MQFDNLNAASKTLASHGANERTAPEKPPLSLPPGVNPEIAVARVPAPSRDPALDVLRGWAIVLMVVNHTGPVTRVSTIAHFTWYVTAANWFVALSGVVLGMVGARRLAKSGPWETYRKLLLRARTIWLVHCVLMFAVLIIHETTGRIHNVPSVRESGGWLNVLWMVPSLRLTSNEFLNVLPMYVILLAFTPVAMEFLRRRKAVWLMLLSFTLYCLAQKYPEWGRLADPVSGKRVFNLEAWQLVYVVGLVVGFYRDRITNELWPRHRGWFMPVCIAIFAFIFVFAQLQRPTFAWLGCSVPAAAPFFWGKLTAAPGQTVYFFVTLVVGYFFVNKMLESGHSHIRKALIQLEGIGRFSLYCFLIHIAIAVGASAVESQSWPLWTQEILTLLAVCAVCMMVKYQVLARYIPN